jgi:hypothetical protein
MRRGSAWPLMLIVALFLTIPLGYWYLSYRASMKNVRGAKTSEIENGLYVVVNSDTGTWDLNSYLCKSKLECLESLTSGVKLETKSGGRALGYEVDLVYENQWSDYSFLKVFVKPGWGAQGRAFKIIDPGVVKGASSEKINLDNVMYEVVLIPVRDLKSGFFKGAEFSD